MRKTHIVPIIFLLAHTLSAQVVTTEPEFPTADEPVKIIFDVKQASDSRAGGLLGLTDDVYLWSGAGSTENGDAFEFEPPGQTNFNVPYEPGTMTLEGDDIWSITLTPRSYYEVPEGTPIVKLGLLLKNGNGNAQTEDIIIDIFEADEFSISLSSPTQTSLFVNQNDVIPISASASDIATFTLTANGNLIDTQPNIMNYSFDQTVTESSGTVSLVLSADDGSGNTDQVNFSYTLRTTSVEEARPSGIVRGINYNDNDDTKVTLCLQAPNKTSVYAIGDFSNWELNSAYQMKKDGEFFWVEITDLTPGEEYAFQYLVDETIYIADPYCDKILQPDDRFIPDNIYSNLKEYPTEAQNSISFYNTVSVLQTGQTPYLWQNNSFEKPAQTDLVIYELLVRDFFGNGQESYTNLIDTLSYIKSLGVNAIELMPITEFSGNDSWGYNPIFMFAPDKAYGSKNDLKAFIDAAHELGIAVILDMVLNQQEQPSPLILLDFNLSTAQVTEENPYFNIVATHPFNVFYDMNHESSYTQSFVDTVNHYWLNEYRFDGFRFDLSKGFTQTNYGEDVGAWSSYDEGRINILERMADEIWSHTPDAYVILEHFADNTEETELANYGMMLWGNMHGAYKQNILGFSSSSDISWSYHINRGWNDAHAVVYMESHDEERQMYEATQFGNEEGGYSVKDEETALERIAAASAILYTIPGPKMLWQFGELGYAIPIDENGRTGQKPTPWDDSEGPNYYGDSNRQLLLQTISAIINLKTSYSVFNDGTATITDNNDLVKQVSIVNEANNMTPTLPEEMNAVVVSNMEVTSEIVSVNLPHSGEWFDYFSGTSSNFSETAEIEMGPGEFRIFTDVQLEMPNILLPLSVSQLEKDDFIIYPNPSAGKVLVQGIDEPVYYFVYDMNARSLQEGKFNGSDTIDLSKAKPGLLFIEVINREGKRFISKMVKE